MIRVSSVASWTSYSIEHENREIAEGPQATSITSADNERLRSTPPLGPPGEGAENLFKTLARCTGT